MVATRRLIGTIDIEDKEEDLNNGGKWSGM